MLDFVKESDCNIAALMMQTDPEDGMYYAVIFNTKTREVWATPCAITGHIPESDVCVTVGVTTRAHDAKWIAERVNEWISERRGPTNYKGAWEIIMSSMEGAK